MQTHTTLIPKTITTITTHQRQHQRLMKPPHRRVQEFEGPSKNWPAPDSPVIIKMKSQERPLKLPPGSSVGKRQHGASFSCKFKCMEPAPGNRIHLTLLVCILHLVFNGQQIGCIRRSDHWAERNTTTNSFGQLDSRVGGAISLLEPTTSSQQQEFPPNNNINIINKLVGLPQLPSPSGNSNQVLSGSSSNVNKLDYIVEFMRTNRLTKFCDLLTSEEPEMRALNERLNSLDQFTLFVPTNEAILLMPTSQMEQIKANPQETKQFLLAHTTNELVAPKQTPTTSTTSLSAPTNNITIRSLVYSLAGSPLHITTAGPGDRNLELIVNGANIITGQSYALQEQNNNSAIYAIVHLVDRVLYPAPSFKLRDMLRLVAPKMARYVELASDRPMEEQLNSLASLTTVFASNDDAFKLMPKKVIDQLETNRTFLVNFLRGHLLDGLYYGAQLGGGRDIASELETNGTTMAKVKLVSLSGTELQFESKRLQSRNLILVNSIPIIEQDLVGLNGLIHLIARPIFEGQLSETCRCGLSPTQVAGTPSTLRTPANLTTGGDLAAYEKLWSTSAPNRPSVGPRPMDATTAITGGSPSLVKSWNGSESRRTISSENPAHGNELEREESNLAPVAQQDKMAQISQRIRAQRSGMVTRNNKDFYRPLAAPSNLLINQNSGSGEASPLRQQEAATSVALVPPISLAEASDIQRQRPINGPTEVVTGSGVLTALQGGESGRLKQLSNNDQLGSMAGPNSGDLFEVERYKIILNAATRQRMREQQQQQQGSQDSASVRQFAYDRSLVSTPGTRSPDATFEAGTRRPYSPINATSFSSLPSANISGWLTGTDQLTLSASNNNSSRQQRLLKFQPEDARDLTTGSARLHNITSNTGSPSQVTYNVMMPADDHQSASSSNRLQRQQQMMGKTVAPGEFGGCAFYDTDCKRLFGRLVRLPTGGGGGGKRPGQQFNNQLNNSTASPNQKSISGSTEQHLDSTFGETTETPLGGGWTKSMQVQPPSQQSSQKLQQQQPVKTFHRLSPARVSSLNQPLPPWNDEESIRLPLAPNWRPQDRDIARITGPYVGPIAVDRKYEHPFGGGVGFTSGISRETPTATTPSGKLAAITKQPAAAEQIYLTPVGVIQAQEIRHQLQQNYSQRIQTQPQPPPNPHELLRDGNKAIFVSPSPILRISQPTRLMATSSQPLNIRGQQQQQQATIGFANNQQYHTPTPYSVSLITTHLPPIFNNAPATQFSRLTNFTAIDNVPEDLPSNSGVQLGSNKLRSPVVQFEKNVPRAPAAHRKQRLQQVQMDNNGSFGANFDLNPANGEKQSRRIVRLQANEPAKQTILVANEEEFNSHGGDISVTSAKLTPIQNAGGKFGALATQASNQAPNVSSSSSGNNFIRSAPLLSDLPDQAIDFFQDRTIAEIMDDSGLRIDGQQVTFSRLKECITEADLLSLVSQTGSSVTIFMPTDSAFHRLVQQQAIAQQRGPSSSRSSRLVDPNRRHLLPLVARRPKSLAGGGASSSQESSRRLVPVGDILTSGDLSAGSLNDATGAANAAERLTLDCASSQVRQVLLDHLSARLITPKQLQHDLGISSLSGHQLLLSSVPSKKIVVVDGQPVIAATRAKNGMVYVVNKFLNLTQQVPNVVDLMETQQNLTTFLSYLRFSSLADRLKREMGPLTVLAPTNEAFDQLSSSARQLINSDPAALTENMLTNLLNNINSVFIDILRGHIVDGAQFGKLMSMRNQLSTMNPDQRIEAKVIKPNVYLFDNQMTSMRLVGTTGNGVVNSIDRLIVPGWLRITLGSNNKPQAPTSGSNLFSTQLSPNPLGGTSTTTTTTTTARSPLFSGELEGDLFGGSALATPPIVGNSASLNLPVISHGQPVRFERPGGGGGGGSNIRDFVASPNNFLLTDLHNNNLINSSNVVSNSNNNNLIRVDPLARPESANSLLENNQSPFLRVANNLSNSSSSSISTINDSNHQTIKPPSQLINNDNNNNVNLNVNVNSTRNMQLIEKLANLMQASKFVKYLIRSRVSEQLKPDMNYVILVPTDQAIDKLPKQIIEMLERDSERLADLMNYHILDTTFEYINTIPDGQTLNTMNEKDILFNWHRNNTILTASGAVVMGGIQEDNIALLIVDRVLYPTPGDILNIISKSPILSKFTSLVRNAGLERQLSLPGPFTLFAPSDFAFNQMDRRDLDTLERNKESARRFLLRHLTQPTIFTSSIALASNGTRMLITNSLGEDLTLRQRNDYFSVNDVNFSYADVAATNGVVHVIDGLL